jgi:hypothetical protein
LHAGFLDGGLRGLHVGVRLRQKLVEPSQVQGNYLEAAPSAKSSPFPEERAAAISLRLP